MFVRPALISKQHSERIALKILNKLNKVIKSYETS
jgi:hypothetical protein